MNIGQILSSAVSSIIGILLASLLVRWQHARAARNAASGRPVSVPASIRTASARLWRSGTVNIHGTEIVWTPRMPWAREFQIGAVSFGSRQTPVGLTRWLLPPAAVVVPCEGAGRGYELAILPDSVKYLFWAQQAAI